MRKSTEENLGEMKELVKPEVLMEIEEAWEDARQGRSLSHEQAKRELFGDE